jgi:histone H2A
MGAPKKKSTSKSQKAGLTFPVARVNKYMKTHSGLKRVGGSSPIYMTAVIEYVAAEIIELAGNKTKAASRKTINHEDLLAAIRLDSDLAKFLAGTSVCVGDKLAKVSETIKYVPGKAKKSQADDA